MGTISLRVSREDEEQLSDRLGVPVRPVSAKQGNGVDEAFNELISLAEQRHLSQTGQSFLRPKRASSKASLGQTRNSFVNHARWPLPKRLLNKSFLGFKRSDTKQQTAQNPTLTPQSSGLSNTSAPGTKPASLGIAKLGPDDEAKAERVESEGGGGQSPVPSLQAENGMTGVVSSYWIRIGPPRSPLTY